MLETLETRKKQHEMKIKNTKVLQPIFVGDFNYLFYLFHNP